MTKPTGTLALALREVTALLAALGEDMRDRERALALLESLGLAIPDPPTSLLSTGAAIAKVEAAAAEYQAAVEASGEGSPQAVAKLLALSAASAETFAELFALGPKLEADLAAYPGLLTEMDLALLAQRLVEWALVAYLRARAPLIYNSLALIGVVDPQVQVEEGEYARPHVRPTLRWSQLGLAVEDPGALLAEVYGWGTTLFDDRDLLRRVHYLLMSGGLTLDIYPAGKDSAPASELRLPLFAETGEGGAIEMGLTLGCLEGTEVGTDVGLIMRPYAVGTAGTEFEMRPGLRVALRGAFEGAGDLGISVRPPLVVALIGDADAGARLVITIEWRREDGAPIVLVSQPDLVAIQLAGIRAELEADLDDQRGVKPSVRLAAVDGELKITPGGGDGFLRQVVPTEGITASFELGIAWSEELGLRFVGSAGFEVTLPVHVSLGEILNVDSIHLAIDASEGGGMATASATFAVNLGPLRATVERMGFAARLTPSPNGGGFPPGSGNLGPVDLAFAFKPPNGVGLSVDLAVLTGGGYLDIDPDRGEYSGALELELGGFLAVKAIGLITTRMSDGARGFSLLLVLIGEFGGGGLQLGYGFRLLAVGGLVGVNRSMRLDALVEGVRSGAIESVMFPRDIVANAPRILSDLRVFFPPEQGKFLVGPMAKIGWGTPTLITISVGVIIEIPGNIAIVGVLRVVLPTEKAPLLVLQANFVGAIEPDKQRLWFFASLFESRVLLMSIDGEMGVMVVWGSDPNLVLSVGGFHPAFTPPPLAFPTPRRVSIDILNDSTGRIRVSGYFAVTSNTAQFGAHAELYFLLGEVSIEGHIGYDALFRFSPFAFVIGVSAAVALKVFGVGVFSISLDFALEGPTPWRAHGRGSITLLFLEVSADFDITWGEERDTTLPPVDVLPLLVAEFAKLENWQTLSPVGGNPLVSLRTLADSEKDLVLHPLGMLVVRQRAIPLDLRLDKIGSQRPKDGNRFTVTVAGSGLVRGADTDEMFALAQFQDMDDAAKLSRRAYEPQHGGLEVSVDGGLLASSRAVRRSARYEQSVIDKRRTPERFVPYPASLFTHLLAGNSVSRSPLARRQAELRQPFSDTIEVTGEQFVVANTRTNVAVAAPFGSEAAALDHLASKVAEDPRLAGSLHVLPGVERGVAG